MKSGSWEPFYSFFPFTFSRLTLLPLAGLLSRLPLLGTLAALAGLALVRLFLARLALGTLAALIALTLTALALLHPLALLTRLVLLARLLARTRIVFMSHGKVLQLDDWLPQDENRVPCNSFRAPRSSLCESAGAK
jgi:cell division protein FtsW (lipid II flippase)